MSVKKEITAGTIAGVLSPIILLALGLLWAPVRSVVGWIISTIWSLFTSVISWLGSPVWMPRWITYLLIGYVVFVIGRLIVKKLNSTDSSQSDSSTSEDFTEFEFRGLKWRWKWKWGQVADLACFCPNCDRHMRYTDERFRLNQRVIEVLCSNCPSVRQEYIGRFSDFENDTQLEIDHAVRTGEWKRWVERLQS